MGQLWRICVLFGVFLVLNAPLIRCEDESEETETTPDEEHSEGGQAENLNEDGIAEENDVLVLTESNFDDVVDSKEIILVEFYAPWCGHCKSLAPKYEAAAGRLKSTDPVVPLAKVDATENRDLAERFGVSGYPTLKFFKSGEAYDYEGPREEDGIVEYMLERADPSWEPPPEAVITLTEENFNEVIGRENLILVEFYAPWCGHCKQLAPKYEKAAQQLAQNDPPIPLAKVDATVETDVASRYNVNGYPTLQVFRKGKPFEYKGGRDEYSIVDYMRKQVEDPSTEKSSVKDIMKHVSTVEDAVVLGVFSSETDPMFEVYSDTANELREDYVFLHTFNADVAKHYKVNPGSLVLFRSERFHTKYEPKWHVFNQADATVEDLKKFITGNEAPLVGQLTMRTKEKLYKELRPLVVVFFTVDWSFDHREATQLWRNKVADVAAKQKSFTFTIADEDEMKDLFKDFGFDESGEEVNIGILDSKQRKYPMEPFDTFDADEIADFLKQFNKGKIAPRIKSQPVPKKQAVLKTVVGKNFDKIVKDPTKDVLIEFYAPWCGHCKKLEPIYKELAKKYKSDKKLVIAKIDATANDYPDEYEASGYPTIYFAPADNKENPIKHEGGRELEDLEEFISQHATVALGRAPGKDEL